MTAAGLVPARLSSSLSADVVRCRGREMIGGHRDTVIDLEISVTLILIYSGVILEKIRATNETVLRRSLDISKGKKG